MNGWEIISSSIKYLPLNVLMKFHLRPSLDCTVSESISFTDDVILNGTVCPANLTELEKLRNRINSKNCVHSILFFVLLLCHIS